MSRLALGKNHKTDEEFDKELEEMIEKSRNFFKSEEVKLEDLGADSKFLSLREGGELTFEVKDLKKITDPDSTFNLSSKDYHYEIHTTQDKVLSVGAWAFWNELRVKLGQRNLIKGVKLKVMHPSQSIYKVEVLN